MSLSSRHRRRFLSSIGATDGIRSIATALSLCAFLWLLKAVLIAWYLISKGIHPLGDAPILGVLAIGGADLFFCAVLAVVYYAIFSLARRLPRPAAYLLRGPVIFLIHAALAIFAVASFQVTRLYGWPLEIEHLRSADDPRIIAASVASYAGTLPLLLMVLGIAFRPLLVGPICAGLAQLHSSSPPRRLWLRFAAVAGSCGVIWVAELQGIDTYGTKDNAVVFFLTHYSLPIGAIDAHAVSTQLANNLGPTKIDLAAPTSIQLRAGLLATDYVLPPDGAAKGFNVLLFQMESTSAAYVDAATTPNLMRLAQHGISFRNHATVFCESVRANYGIHYSDYLTDIGTTPRMLYGNSAPMPSLAEAIKSEGYQTAVFSSAFMKYNDLLYLFQNKGVDTIVQADQLWKGESLPWSWGVREEKGIEALCSWIGDHRSHPFFATYLTTFPHHPYICPIDDQPFTGNGWRDRYRNSLHYADMCLGKLLDRLSALHLLDTTIIAVVGDHGETVSSYPVGHGLALTREEVFTPFIVSNPRLFPEPQESELSTSHLDIAPTLASLVGAKIPADWLGRNLMTEQIPARLSFIQAKLAHVHGIVDNGIIYVFEAARNRSHLFDFHTGGFSPLDATDPRQSITSLYRDADETFQKWAVWRHMARASGELDHLVAAESRQPTTMPTRHASLLP